jgi:hypothetical protein
MSVEKRCIGSSFEDFIQEEDIFRAAEERVAKAVADVEVAQAAVRSAWGDAWRASEKASELATAFDVAEMAVKRTEKEVKEASRELRELKKEKQKCI